MKNPNWSREELIVAFNLYCKTPFSKIGYGDKGINELSVVIGRSVAAVAMKLANFARFDPALQARGIKGLKGGSKGEEPIWKEFNGNWDTLAFESERILAGYKQAPIEVVTNIETWDLPTEGKTRDAVVKQRVNQSFFRSMVLASFNNTCCITGINNSDLLIASHIVPWSKDLANGVNPHNGLCLNALHDKAFDKSLITITPDLKIVVSTRLLDNKNAFSEKYFLPYHNREIIKPLRFLPSEQFLETHNKEFQKLNS